MSDGTQINVADVLAVDAEVTRSTGSAQFGITQTGFTAKPFARLLAEKLALAQSLFGDDLDLTSGSAIRKLLEVSALEDARTWAALSSMYDNSFIGTATGEALSRLGEELGIPRPHQPAQGTVTLTLNTANLPADQTTLTVLRGARLLTDGEHHIFTTETVDLSASSSERQVAVEAFYPGSEHNLNPDVEGQKINRWHPDWWKAYWQSQVIKQLEPKSLIDIQHTAALTGGDLQWPDTRYRELLVRAPRSLWTADAIEFAVSLIPGVRQVQVRDPWGGLDLSVSTFGEFNFLERVFTSERDLSSPYYFTVLVAKELSAIWEGTNGLKRDITSAIEDLRPISIFPKIQQAEDVSVGLTAEVWISDSQTARDLKARLLRRVQRYVDSLQFGQPVRWSEVMWSLMNEPGVVDVQNLRLLRYPPTPTALDFTAAVSPKPEPKGDNIVLRPDQVPVFVDDDSDLFIRT
ncbi:baseplate j family protein [Leptolyngbya sp. Heron Island J]|uniref:baseplate J/gp47 family protein n=1 Tax=Leptolyngbya sp. Heron Island J TaxID=1385935 RepID=UPI0003B9DEB5|nr:baseplate J/gp47 family protein [Leptolyngbya sp. Heron Island J]ESA32881.1 baseplate j family protein [Leptolyngbya sp. Heron Island J]